MDNIEIFWDVDKYYREIESQKQKYLKSKMGLQGDYLIGKVKYSLVVGMMDKYFVENLVSPENGLSIDKVMLEGVSSVTNYAFGSNASKLKEKNIKTGDLVLFKFKPGNNYKDLINKGKLLAVDESNVTLLQNAAQFLREAGIDIEEVRVDYYKRDGKNFRDIFLKDSLNHDVHESDDEKLHKIYPLPSLYHDVLKKYLEKEWDDIANREEVME